MPNKIVHWRITVHVIGGNLLSQCLNCRTISLGLGVIHLDKLVRSVGLCLNLNDPAKIFDCLKIQRNPSQVSTTTLVGWLCSSTFNHPCCNEIAVREYVSWNFTQILSESALFKEISQEVLLYSPIYWLNLSIYCFFGVGSQYFPLKSILGLKT